MAQKAMRVRMMDPQDGTGYWWKVSKAEGGWDFTDHEGYTRYAEGQWFDLVARFKMVAENYGLTTNIS